MELWDGTSSDKKKKTGKNGNVRVSQPISGQQMMPPPASTYTDGTAISSLPTNDVTYGSQSTGQSQQLPNYDSMYRQDTTPLVGAATPGMAEGFDNGPMAANSVLGGGAFGSAW
jgi:hypothetical protein